MPLIPHSSYRPPFGFQCGHLQTIYPTLFRRTPWVTTERERISTADGDFLDLDWARTRPSRKLAILSHGLEGSSRRSYVQGMAQALDRAGWHVLAWNFRGCSGEPNLKLQSYHSGSINDLEAVINHSDSHNCYEQIALVGFSLGGNITLKLLGDFGHYIHPKIKAAVTISVATDLAGGAQRLERFGNRIYMRRFMKTLHGKVREKMTSFPDEIEDEGLDAMRTFREFDDAYTAPIHGFASVQDYWRQCSSNQHLKNITIPTLLINAQDDPFLSSGCYPVQAAQSSSHFHLEMPKHGGHMGFIEFNHEKEYWSEQRTVSFLNENIPAPSNQGYRPIPE